MRVARTIQSKLLGAAGEHAVMSRLLLMGVTACLAPDGAKGVDIVLTNAVGESFAAIQVKAKVGRFLGPWRLSPAAELLISPRLFYVFVGFENLANGLIKELLVVPSKVVADFVKLGHRNWLQTPGLNGRVRNDSTVRFFAPNPRPITLDGVAYASGWTKIYENNWDLILNKP